MTGLDKYSKLIGSVLGGMVAFGFSYASSQGLATCAIVDGTETCTIAGLSQGQVTGFLVFIACTFGTWISPPNSPLGGRQE